MPLCEIGASECTLESGDFSVYFRVSSQFTLGGTSTRPPTPPTPKKPQPRLIAAEIATASVTPA